MASLQAFPSSLLPRAWSRALILFPFLFERLPRRLGASGNAFLREEKFRVAVSRQVKTLKVLKETVR